MPSLRARCTVCVLSLAATTSISLAQNFNASCDNRSGSTHADVVDTSDPTENGYNIDPSEIYKAINAISYPATQNSGSSTSSATLTVTSKFIGNNPGVLTTGFVANVTGSVSVTPGTEVVNASSSDMQSICMTLSGVSSLSPVYYRLVGSQTVSSPLVTASIVFTPPVGLPTTVTPGTAINQPMRLTSVGEYRLNAQFNTGLITRAPGTGTASANATSTVAFVCLGDFNGDGDINVSDIFGFLRAWFSRQTAADSNVDGTINVSDIFTFLRTWFGKCQ